MASINVIEIFISLAFICACDAKRVLMLSFPGGGHIAQTGVLGKLLMSHNHDVYMLIEKSMSRRPEIKASGMNTILYDVGELDTTLSMRSAMLGDAAVGSHMKNQINTECIKILYDEEIQAKIKSLKFDLAVVDGFAICRYLIPKKHGIPFITFAGLVYPWLSPGLTPIISGLTCLSGPNHRSMSDRFRHFQAYIEALHDPFTLLDEAPLLDYLPGQKLKTLLDLSKEAMLTLVVHVPVLDCPIVMPPNMINVAGISRVTAKPLTGQFKQFMDAATQGAIIVSFGSQADADFPADVAEKFIDAFGRLEQQVFWRLDNSKFNLKVSDNVHLSKWLPQKGLLAHKNAKVFITHCGQNGQVEAFYNGVPMLGFPLFGDQPYNAHRTVVQGFGLQMDINHFTADELHRNLVELISNPSYSKTIKAAAIRAKNIPGDPSKLAIDWIHHVMEYGGEHLKSPLSYLSISELYMLDIMGAVIISILMLLAVVIYSTVRIVKYLNRKKLKNKKIKSK
ncbi:UDP-glucuronosyltransferase 1A8-like [Tubulanus polymorphus]|uniref:UDP-glucuronosyltransferase 1A8-like n=1 Tax=Tubulanus polymorphus TaxID=672921 RepID=UPI003DA577CE